MLSSEDMIGVGGKRHKLLCIKKISYKDMLNSTKNISNIL